MQLSLTNAPRVHPREHQRGIRWKPTGSAGRPSQALLSELCAEGASRAIAMSALKNPLCGLEPFIWMDETQAFSLFPVVTERKATGQPSYQTTGRLKGSGEGTRWGSQSSWAQRGAFSLLMVALPQLWLGNGGRREAGGTQVWVCIALTAGVCFGHTVPHRQSEGAGSSPPTSDGPRWPPSPPPNQ